MPGSRGLRKRRSEPSGEIIRRSATSGLSSSEFCRREGLALSSLQRWRARLTEPSLSGEFVELIPPPAAEAGATSPWMVELTLPGGMCLRFRG